LPEIRLSSQISGRFSSHFQPFPADRPDGKLAGNFFQSDLFWPVLAPTTVQVRPHDSLERFSTVIFCKCKGPVFSGIFWPILARKQARNDWLEKDFEL
jgi:hypothetical protein